MREAVRERKLAYSIHDLIVRLLFTMMVVISSVISDSNDPSVPSESSNPSVLSEAVNAVIPWS